MLPLKVRRSHSRVLVQGLPLSVYSCLRVVDVAYCELWFIIGISIIFYCIEIGFTAPATIAA